jgi:hypothetical protein
MSQTITPTPEQMQRAQWDQLLADHDRKRQEVEFEPRKYRLHLFALIATAFLAGAAVFAAGATWFQPRSAQPIVIQLPAPKP